MTDIIKQYQDKVDKMRWSFSRLNSFDSCKYCWFQNYINKNRGGNNAFAEYGSLMHELLEGFTKGEIMYWDMEDMFMDRFYEEVGEFPPNKWTDLRETYFNQGIDYIKNFDGFSQYEILEVEPEITLDINGYEFIGYIDLLVRNKKNGKIIVIDHKSKAKFKDKEETKKYARQLYLYAIWVKEKYGEYPYMLKFNMFRKQTEKTIIFKEKDLQEAIDWMMDTIQDIRNAKEFPVIEDDFFGKYLCNHKDAKGHILGKNYTIEELWKE